MRSEESPQTLQAHSDHWHMATAALVMPIEVFANCCLPFIEASYPTQQTCILL